MPTSTPVPPPLPDMDKPVVDLKTGMATPELYKYLAFMDRIIRQLRKEVP
ncbi:hypothetical protein RA307_04740 [Xanthobacteraceae bacterium Astr-EGSB]|nr:hypothetical protein [Xanthobacteraceae bacterium Astr-EGSB]